MQWASCVNHDKNGFGGQRSLGLPGQLNELYAALAVFFLLYHFPSVSVLVALILLL